MDKFKKVVNSAVFSLTVIATSLVGVFIFGNGFLPEGAAFVVTIAIVGHWLAALLSSSSTLRLRAVFAGDAFYSFAAASLVFILTVVLAGIVFGSVSWGFSIAGLIVSSKYLIPYVIIASFFSYVAFAALIIALVLLFAVIIWYYSPLTYDDVIRQISGEDKN